MAGGRASSRLLAPAATAAVVGAATLAVAVRDPHVAGSWGVCPWLLLTGTACPGCGGLRAVNDLVHLDVVGALSSNAFVVVSIVLAAALWVAWVRAALRGRALAVTRWVNPTSAYVWLAVLLVFSVVRNLPFAAWLAP